MLLVLTMSSTPSPIQNTQFHIITLKHCIPFMSAITLPRIHNLLPLSAQYQMEPGSNHSTKESTLPPPLPPPSSTQGRTDLQRGMEATAGSRMGGRPRRIGCCNLIPKAEREAPGSSRRKIFTLSQMLHFSCTVLLSFIYQYINILTN